MKRFPLFLAASLAAVGAAAQQKPPAGYTPTPEERAQLDQKMSALTGRLKTVAQNPDWPDAAVFLHTAEMADRLHLYTNKNGVTAVLRGLDTGLARCEELARGAAPWKTQPGKSLRGYVSRVDGSVQPYGVVLPAGYNAAAKTPMRLDVVLHGRGPTEVSFLQQNEPANNKAPDQPFLQLEPFGRANNGWRWSGETDVFEALDHFKKQYAVDPNRTVLRGFSMGGHGSWQIGVHYPDLWSAVSPGAGFTDTRKYLKITGEVPPYQERAWHIYDAVDYALNLFNTPFVGYGGEKDPQLQATLNMKEAAEKEGVPLTMIIGPGVEHKYHPDSLKEIMERMAAPTRNPTPKQVKFATWTLKYNKCFWVTVDGLEQHYRKAVVTAETAAPLLTVKTDNITALTLDPLPVGVTRLQIDGQEMKIPAGLPLHLTHSAGKWGLLLKVAKGKRPLQKQHGLQGPIDDAFMEKFVVVRGTGTPWNSGVQAYADAALQRFQADWRDGFRGEVPVKEDRAATEADWKDANLVLFGDPGSNALLARIADRLPIRWTREGVVVAGKNYGADAVPVLVYPNPLNPSRYVVINSGHTFTAKDIAASNANLTPKLPDWAILKPGGGQAEVLAAEFFDESWKLKGGR